MDEQFICTYDVNTANKLRALGLKELINSNGQFTFLNSKTISFSNNDIDINKIKYTNKLCI